MQILTMMRKEMIFLVFAENTLRVFAEPSETEFFILGYVIDYKESTICLLL